MKQVALVNLAPQVQEAAALQVLLYFCRFLGAKMLFCICTFEAIDILLGVVLVPHVLTCSLPSLLSADALLRLLLTDGVGALLTPCSSQGQLAHLQH
jgi:hypothetical protein